MTITIASGKGGTGKTTLSSNLASYLANQGKNIVLADLDVEEPNSSLFLKLEKKETKIANKMVPHWNKTDCTLCGKCVEVCAFNAIAKIFDEILVYPQLCHSCYACSELCPTDSLPMRAERIGEITHYKTENFDFVEGRIDLGQEMSVPLISQTIDYVNENFSDSLKLFDAPPGTSCPVIEATKESDFVILITESTPFGYNDLVLAVETMKVLNKKMGVVINRYGIGDNQVEEYCKKENIPIIAKIQNDKEIAKTYAKGGLLYEKIPHFRKSLDDVVKFIGELK